MVRFNWEHVLVIMYILNDGNIYGTKNIYFSDPFGPVVTQYYELRNETTCIEQPTIATLQCIKNQLPTRSGNVYTDESLYAGFKQFSGPRKMLKTQWKTHFSIKSKNFIFNNIFDPL